MDDLLVTIARSQREDYLSLQAQAHLEISRDAEVDLAKNISSPLVKIVIGPRRAGKSTLIRRVLTNTPHAYFSFEDERLPSTINTGKLLTALNTVWGNTNTIYFDEIQNLPKWEKFIHRLHAARKNVFVTGSNSKLLSKELSSALTGRHFTITLLPFSWEEARRVKPSKEIADQEFLNYLQDGGFPDVVARHVPSSGYINQLYDSILMRDIVQRYRIRNISALRSLCDLLIRSVGSRVSGRSLQKALPIQLNNTTIENYLRYTDEAFLVTMLQKFEPSLSKQKKADRKPYVYDTGFLRAISPSQISDSFGQLLENYVFLSLIRQGAVPNIDLFYYTDNNQYEVDFIWFQKTKNVRLIQSCWTLAETNTRQRELRALTSAAKKFHSKDLTIVTFGERREYREGDYSINVVPAPEVD